MNTSLHTIQGMNQFCGPGVLSALTGRSTDECAAVISAVSGRQEIRSVSVGHLIEAFKRLKFDMTQQDRKGYTLFANLNVLAATPGMYIVMVPKHVVAVEVVDNNHLYLIDNHSKSPVPAEGSARLSQKCDAIYKITAKPQPIYLRTEIIIDNDSQWGCVKIRAIEIYENPEDNVNMSLGQFTYRNKNELESIAHKIYDIAAGRLQ